MIVVLDSTVLVEDPTGVSDGWRSLLREAKTWPARIVVPTVVLLETVANIQKSASESLDSITKVRNDHGKIGFRGESDALSSAIRTIAETCEDTLRDRLTTADVEFQDPADVDHLEVVRRSVKVRKPYDEKVRKDGYKDTLNWLTLLEVAEQNPDDQIYWVSNNSRDFGDASQSDWHEHLAEELEQRGLRSRVRWYKKLPDLVAAVAATRTPVDSAEQARLSRLVTEGDEVFQLIASETRSRTAEPRALALPVDTVSARFIWLDTVHNLELKRIADTGDGHLIAQFAAEAAGFLSYRTENKDELVAKALTIEGVLDLSDQGQVRSVAISDVKAAEDDPGRKAWMLHDLTHSPGWYERLQQSAATTSFKMTIHRTLKAAESISPAERDAALRLQRVQPILDKIQRGHEPTPAERLKLGDELGNVTITLVDDPLESE